MSSNSLEKLGLDRPESGDDSAVPFTLDRLGCRGRSIRLAESLNQIISAHAYPAPVARVLGEAVLLAALVGSSLKIKGRFILQTRTDGPVNMIVVDLDAPDGLRGYARFDSDKLAAGNNGCPDTASLLGSGSLAMTIDQGEHTERYQGVVAITGKGLEVAAQHYFGQSEQILTAVRLAVAEYSVKGGTGPKWRAGGILLQFLPETGGQPTPDFPSGVVPDREEKPVSDPDNWLEAETLFSTLSEEELVEPLLSSERLLFRLFNEKGVRVFEPERLEARCTCSADRTEAMLQNSFSEKERLAMAVDGEIEVRCEFCSAAYYFNPNQFQPEE